MPAGGACPPAGSPPSSGRIAARALTAEFALGWRAVVRQRAWRLAVLLALLGVAAAGARGALTNGLVLMAAGMLGAVAGPPLLARGPMLSLQRRCAAAWWITPLGRALGAVAAVAPAIACALAVLLLGRTGADVVVAGASALVFACACIACGMALGTAVGESAAGAIGFMAVWIGSLPPSAMHELLGGVPYLQRPVVILWNTLPLAWRARAVLAGSLPSHLLLLAWTALAVVLAAWVAGYVFRDAEPARRAS